MYLQIGRLRVIGDSSDASQQETLGCLLEIVKLQYESFTVKDALLKMKADGSAELIILSGRVCSPMSTLKCIQDARLSSREMDILARLLYGDSNKHMARHLDISEATVKIHMKSLLRKLGVTNRTQAALWAMKNGITPAGFEEGSNVETAEAA